MKWKTWILACIVLAGVCLLTDQVFTRVFILGNPMSDASRIQHLIQDNSDDIPIFGSSKAHGHFCPADMGMHAFNYGMNGLSYEVTDVFLDIELAKPRTTPIILELQHRDTGTLGERSRYIPFATDPRFTAVLKKFDAMSWRFYLPGIRYFGYYDVLFSYYASLLFHMEKSSQGYGELVHTPPFNRAQLNEYVQERLKAQNGCFPDEDQNRRLIAHITGHPQRLFFLVVSPYHPSYYARFENADKFEEFKKKLTAMPNVVVLDWGRSNYPEEDFLDTLHLTRPGAAKFSRQMGAKMREILQQRNQSASPVASPVK